MFNVWTMIAWDWDPNAKTPIWAYAFLWLSPVLLLCAILSAALALVTGMILLWQTLTRSNREQDVEPPAAN
jgi:hypothetical protein